jgi:hypothetical protein
MGTLTDRFQCWGSSLIFHTVLISLWMSETIVPPSAPVAAVTIINTHLSSVASCWDVSLGEVMTLAELELLPTPPEPPPLPAPVSAVIIACLFCSRISFLRCVRNQDQLKEKSEVFWDVICCVIGTYQRYINSSSLATRYQSKSQYNSVCIMISPQVGKSKESWYNPQQVKISVCSQKCPDWHWDPPSLLFHGYQGLFPGSKAFMAWSWLFRSS